MTIISIQLEPQSVDRIQSFCGPQNHYVNIIEEQLGIEVSGTNFDLKVLADTQEHAELAQHVIQALYALTEQKGKVYYLEEKDVYNTIHEVRNLFRHNLNRQAEILEQVASLKNLFALNQDLSTNSAPTTNATTELTETSEDLDNQLLNSLLDLTRTRVVKDEKAANLASDKTEIDVTALKAAKVDYSQYQQQSVTPEADRLKHLLATQKQNSAENVLLESDDEGDLSLDAEVTLEKQLAATEAGIALTSNKLSADDVDNMLEQVLTTDSSGLEEMLINGSKLNQTKEGSKSKNVTEHNQLTSSSLPWEAETSEALYDNSRLSSSELEFVLASLKQALADGAVSDDVLEEISRYREIIAQSQFPNQQPDSPKLNYQPKVELEISLPEDIAQLISDYEGQVSADSNPAVDPDILRYGVSSMLQELEQQNLTTEQELALIQKFFADLANGQLQASLTPDLDNLEAELTQLNPKRNPQDYAPDEQVKLTPEIANDIFKDFDQLFSPAAKTEENIAVSTTDTGIDLNNIDLFADYLAQSQAESEKSEILAEQILAKDQLMQNFEKELASLGLLGSQTKNTEQGSSESLATELSKLEAKVQDTINFKFSQLQDQVTEILTSQQGASSVAAVAELNNLIAEIKQELKLTLTQQFATAHQQNQQKQQQVRELQEQILALL